MSAATGMLWMLALPAGAGGLANRLYTPNQDVSAPGHWWASFSSGSFSESRLVGGGHSKRGSTRLPRTVGQHFHNLKHDASISVEL